MAGCTRRGLTSPTAACRDALDRIGPDLKVAEHGRPADLHAQLAAPVRDQRVEVVAAVIEARLADLPNPIRPVYPRRDRVVEPAVEAGQQGVGGRALAPQLVGAGR